MGYILQELHATLTALLHLLMRASACMACMQAALVALMYQSTDLFTYRPVMLAYRKDVLASRGLPVPDTWEQLLQVRLGMVESVSRMGAGWLRGSSVLSTLEQLLQVRFGMG